MALFWLELASSMLDGMRRNGLLVGGWAVATVLALVLGMQGIRSVSNSVTDHRPAPLSPSSVRAALQRTSTSSTSTTTTTAASSGSAAAHDDRGGSTLSSDVVAPRVNGDGGSTASDGPSESSSDDNSGSDTASDPSSSSSGSDDSTSSSSSASSAPFEDRVYQLDGGSVAVRFQDSAAHLLWATPNRDEGYSTEEAQENGGTVEVRFRNDQHESRLRAYWDNGPQREIEEQNDG